MFRSAVAVLILATSFQAAEIQDNPDMTLERAERLYYEARFKEAIDLLLPLDAALRSQQEGLEIKIKVKLQLALAHIGLSETSMARDRFAQIVDLDPGYSLEPRQYSEKVIELFDEVKEERNTGRCRSICMEGDKLLERGDARSLLAQVQMAAEDCACLQATALDAAEHFYQQGLEAYKNQDFTTALENLRYAAGFQPEHTLAHSYIQLTLDKLRLAADQLFLEWRQNFEARQFELAAAAYRRLESANIEGSAKNSLNQAVTLYRQSVTRIVEDWKRACANSSDLGMRNAQLRAADLLPDSAIAADLLDEMRICRNRKCLEIADHLAMARLKSRVDPEIPASAVTRSTRVRVQARIDEDGNVSVKGVRGGNAAVQNAVKGAVEQWKFLPAIVEQQVRCVETEIPIEVGN
jgi:hypothetical protein